MTQRLASVIVALREAAALGSDLVEQLVLQPQMSAANAAVFARTQPARSTTRDAVDDARQLGAECARERGTTCAIAAA